MLKKLRKQRNLQLLILGGLSLLFVLWGVGGTLSGQRSYAGTVFGRKIPVRAFLEQEQIVERLSRWASAQQPLSPEQVEGQAWLRLVLLAEARRLRLRVTDEDVVQAIQRLPFFQREGPFDPERYERFLQRQRLLPRQFEEETRQALLIDGLREHVLQTAPVDEAEARRAYERDRERLRVRYVPVEFARFASEAEALSFAVATQHELMQAASSHQPPAKLLRRKQLRMVEPAPFTAHDQLDDQTASAAALAAAVEHITPGQWSEPVAAEKRWLLVQLVAVERPDDAQWAKDRDAFLPPFRGRAEQLRWQSYMVDAIQRAKLKSFLHENAEGEDQ